jgi:hypothetical protein
MPFTFFIKKTIGVWKVFEEMEFKNTNLSWIEKISLLFLLFNLKTDRYTNI